MLRPVTPADTPALLALAAGTDFFKPLEIETLGEVLADYHAGCADLGHRAFAWDEAGALLGFAYHAPAAMTDRAWYLYWIAVEKGRQGRGLGGRMLAFVEADVRARNGRLLIVETSSVPLYDPTRRFYLRYGYTQAATVPDYYADGDGQVIFTKRVGSVAGV
jgi:ribosomal protein S18 acetylase RimI-like enzyme